jgi:hypothetical protein
LTTLDEDEAEREECNGGMESIVVLRLHLSQKLREIPLRMTEYGEQAGFDVGLRVDNLGVNS